MTSEDQSGSSQDEYFTAYSGTTLSNYQSNSRQSEDSLVEFDKTGHMQHVFPDTYFLESPTSALEYAASVAFETRDIPVVMEGRIPVQYRQRKFLPAGVSFPVNTLWIPAEETSRIELIAQALFLGEITEAFSSMVPVDPSSSLRRDS